MGGDRYTSGVRIKARPFGLVVRAYPRGLKVWLIEFSADGYSRGRERASRGLRPHGRWDRVPDPHREVAGSRGQPGAVRAEGDGMDIGLVPAQLADLLPAGDVPQADGVVAAAGRQAGAVRTERQAVHPVPVRQDRELLVRVGVPEAHVAAQRTGGDQAAVRAVGDPIALRVSGQDSRPRTGSPRPRGAPSGRIPRWRAGSRRG